MTCHSSSSSIPTPTFELAGSSSSSASSPASESSFTSSAAGSEGHACTLAIAALPEAELRALMAKLLTDASLQRAIARELHLRIHGKGKGITRQGPVAPPDAVCANCQQVRRATAADGPCAFHPGHLVEDVFEFLSRTPEGRALQIRKTLAMWTCCAEAPQTPGCADSVAHVWLM
ncbi:hypothetical protein DFH09DRAFT_1465157 [Mycena vulgaris]|nr:hypothetical protein DFH09DRAFT_1496254 [Mycena vulgaris]KAJ6570051.1 hypothetical protein DFH09DRAFT_1465157 [Mycena vulgaris]